jgi:hypothetical protein
MDNKLNFHFELIYKPNLNVSPRNLNLQSKSQKQHIRRRRLQQSTSLKNANFTRLHQKEGLDWSSGFIGK